MKRILTALFCLALAGAVTAQAQTIRIRRVDAQPGKSHFVTATLPFSVEISVEGVNNVTGVSFELRYNNAGSVQLSGYSGGSFGSSGLIVLDKSNRLSGSGSINVGALSGLPAGGGGVNDPIVVRLDFITTPDALHNTNTIFSFINAEAVADGSIVKLAGVPVVFNVHGYIDVWPGDADNNGIVDTRDISVIGLFFDDGAPDGRIRGFSRKPASTAWAPQTALAWDSVRVTYADADGSGKVDINDLLVVYANFSKTHKGIVDNGERKVVFPVWSEEAKLTSTSMLVPVNLSSQVPVLGAAATISWKSQADKFRVVGFQRGEAFGSAEGFFTKISDNTQSAQFAVGNFNPGQEVEMQGAVIYLVVEPLTDDKEFTFDIERPTGIRRNGAIVQLGSTTTSVAEHTVDNSSLAVYPNPSSGQATVSFKAERPGDVAVSVVDAVGTVVYSTTVRALGAGELTIPVDMPSVASGVYFVVVKTATGTAAHPISIVR